MRLAYPNCIKMDTLAHLIMNHMVLANLVFWVDMGPYTSVCTSPNTSVALSPFSLKGDLVILPSKQDSQASYDS